MHAHMNTHTHLYLGAKEVKTRPIKKQTHDLLQYKRLISSEDIFRTKLDTMTDRQKLKNKTTNAKPHKLAQNISSGQKMDTVTDRQTGHRDRQTDMVVRVAPPYKHTNPTIHSVKGTELYKSGIETHKGTASPNLAESCEYVF